MKKIFLFLIILLAGCGEKVVIPVIKTPNEINNPKIRNIKIITKNDNINLKQNIMQQIYNVNQIVPNYFQFNEYKSILSADINSSIKDKKYLKTVKIYQKEPICIYNFYQCKSVNGAIFCNDTIKMKLNQKQYNSIKKEIFTKDNYLLYKNDIYKIEKKCKPTQTTIKCEKQNIKIDVKVKIKDIDNKLIFTKDYIAKNIEDSCNGIEYYEGKKIYLTSPLNEIVSKLSRLLAKNIINDIAPHKEYIDADFYDESDVKLSKKDKQYFSKAVSDDSLPFEKLSIFNNLHQKYPKSCVISYDLAVYLIFNKEYSKAYNILNDILNSKCNSDIKDSSLHILNKLNNLY